MSEILGYGGVLTSNSTTTPIVAGDNFEGDWVDVEAMPSVVVSVKTDQDGLFKVEFSPDGVNIDSSLTRYYRVGDIEAPHRFSITRKFVRVVFENTSAVDQTYIRLQTMVGEQNQLNIPNDSVMAKDYDSLSVRPSDFQMEATLGLRQGSSVWNKFGYNSDVDNTAPETVWALGGLFQRMTTADTLDIVSSSADDTAAGTGVQQIVIYGVDENWDSQVEVIALNGLTPVTTTNQWLGVNRVGVFLCGSGGTNAGNITLDTTTGDNPQAYMPAGDGVTQQCIFFVPAKHAFAANWLFLGALKVAGGGGSPRTTTKMYVYSDVNKCRQEVLRISLDADVENHIELAPKTPFPIGERSVVELEVETDVNNTSVSARFSGILVEDVDA